jgi:hypothetical protein
MYVCNTTAQLALRIHRLGARRAKEVIPLENFEQTSSKHPKMIPHLFRVFYA